MPKIVDHDARREEIARIACEVVAAHGFEHATVARIAAAAGYTTGMIAHYYESKQQIILAGLRLMLKRIEDRLTHQRGHDKAGLLGVLSEALPLDERRFAECAFWMAFWGRVSADKEVRRLNAWVHREYLRVYARCFALHWPASTDWPKRVRDEALRSVVTFINGLTASVVTSPADWPPATQVAQLRLQLDMLRVRAETRTPRAAAQS